MKLSLVIPCYNEEATLPLLVNRCLDCLLVENVEIVLVNNGSSDDTQKVLEQLLQGQSLIKLVNVEKNQGYGFGILSGLKAATGDILSWTHADMQTDPADILKGFKLFKQSKTPERLFVKGRRYGRPLPDVFFTMGMAIFESMLLGKIFWDINAQPTMFHRYFFESWDNPPYDFSLDLFAYYMAKKQQLKIKKFPVKFGERVHGVSHWNINWKSKIKFIRRTLNFSLSLKREDI